MTPQSLQEYFSSDLFVNDPGPVDDLLGYPNYHDWDKSYSRTAHLRLDRIRRFRPHGELLEIGSATGSFLLAAQANGFAVRGLDLSSSFAAIARKRGITVDIGAIEDAELPHAQFDLVCNFGGIACWRDPVRALQRIRRSLKPDGIFVFNHFNADNPFARLWRKRHFEFNHASLVIFTDRTMRSLLNGAGFEIVHSETERQYATLSRVIGYFKWTAPLRLLKRLGLSDLAFPVIVPGTKFLICRKAQHASEPTS
jgi:SAM-dependent methyltransferase